MVMISFIIKLPLWLLPQNWVLASLVRSHQLPLYLLVLCGGVCVCLGSLCPELPLWLCEEMIYTP